MSDDLKARLRNPSASMRPTISDGREAADRIEELEAESERLRLALEETVSLLWDDMSKQESVGKHGGYIYMKCRAALAELTGGKDE